MLWFVIALVLNLAENRREPLETTPIIEKKVYALQDRCNDS